MTAPTIVLVHGAFADAASFAPVTRILLDAGHAVRVPAVPNRSLLGDAEYLRSFVEQLDGPVLLAGREDWFWDYRTDDYADGPALADPQSHPATQTTPGPKDRVPGDWQYLLAERAERG
ncbi:MULTISPECIES: hypothetical protein [unclassified Rathayibacter]|uniref:hypothetical protein n=1 Tax=unclassified Rathayibacter TaxID=2609250 RepID=UPI0021572F65|nr:MULTISPECIES: hypothetical protein [unclassified Rathayibacter]